MSSDFKAVAWMRKRREEIDREDEGLSWIEKSEKTSRNLCNDPLWKRLRNPAVKPTFQSKQGT